MGNYTRKEFIGLINFFFGLGINAHLVNHAIAATKTKKYELLINAARGQIGTTLFYDPNYSKINYPMGDVPRKIGVCTDVIIRAYRDGLGIDLQELIHLDMANNFAKYPKIWGLKTTDKNIDHRRVPNIRKFFEHNNAQIPISKNANDYKAGDIITQNILGRPHIGIVSDKFNFLKTRPLIIHNVGSGTQEEDFLFAYEITGHYRFGV